MTSADPTPPDLPPVDRTPPDEADSAGPKPGPFVGLMARLPKLKPKLATGDPALAVQFYRDNDGLGEDPPGSNNNWITRWFGLGAVAWCCETVSRSINTAFGNPDVWQVPGVPGDYGKGFAYVPSMVNAFTRAGLYEVDRASSGQPATLRPGDPVALFGQNHTGIVEADLGDGSFLTREGNYGDRIGQFRRDRRDLDGVCHIPWGTVVPPKPPTNRGVDEMVIFNSPGNAYQCVTSDFHTFTRLPDSVSGDWLQAQGVRFLGEIPMSLWSEMHLVTK